MMGMLSSKRRKRVAAAIAGLAAVSMPSALHAAAGFADPGFGTAVLLAFGMLLLTVMATGWLAVRFLAGRAASAASGPSSRAGILLWAAVAFPVSAIIGIAQLAMNWHLGITAALADPAIYIWGCACGVFVFPLVLPAMLMIGVSCTERPRSSG